MEICSDELTYLLMRLGHYLLDSYSARFCALKDNNRNESLFSQTLCFWLSKSNYRDRLSF